MFSALGLLIELDGLVNRLIALVSTFDPTPCQVQREILDLGRIVRRLMSL